jgi:hypothetical protein
MNQALYAHMNNKRKMKKKKKTVLFSTLTLPSLVSLLLSFAFMLNFINNKNKNYMVLTLFQKALVSINIFNNSIKPVKLELMISLSFAGKDIEASRLIDMIKDVIFNDS